jgi:hypothetical protein
MQPYFFPWIGLFEQIKLSDVYVHYDDVQFSKGSYVNRTRIKTGSGLKWITVPTSQMTLGLNINEVNIDDSKPWCRRHLEFLEQTYKRAPYVRDMLDMYERVIRRPGRSICELAVASLREASLYYELADPDAFLYASQLGVGGNSTDRVVNIVERLGGDIYITGHGARHYLQHEKFEARRIRVEYMHYRRTEYAQLFGEFNPYVSILDLIANQGKDGIRCIASGTVYWRTFLQNAEGFL